MSRSYSKRALAHPELGSLPPSMPLIIPNDREYDVSTNELRPIPGERRSGLKIVPETLRLLESIERPVAVVAICGPRRTGKSYILSRMLGSADAFELGHTNHGRQDVRYLDRDYCPGLRRVHAPLHGYGGHRCCELGDER